MVNFYHGLRNILLFIAVLGLSGGVVAADADKNAAEAKKANLGYKLNPGDMIEVSVWKEPDLQRELLVSPDGYVSLPLIGHIKAAGRNVRTLNKTIAEKLSSFIPDPSVTVTLRQTSGSRFFVMGKVNRPGQYAMTSDISVLQALSVAGGVNVYAKTKSINVVRQGYGKALKFNYDDVSAGKNLKQNIILKSGDVVVVP